MSMVKIDNIEIKDSGEFRQLATVKVSSLRKIQDIKVSGCDQSAFSIKVINE